MSLFSIAMISKISDILVIAIIVTSAVRGYRSGLLNSFFNFFRWSLCAVCGIVFALPIKNFILKHTSLQLNISKSIKETMDSSITANKFIMSLPRQIRLFWDDIRNEATSKISVSLADTLISMLSFILLFAILFILARFALRSLELKKHGVLSLSNRLCGMFFGALKGALLLSIIMLISFPLLSLLDPDTSATIAKGLSHGRLSGFFYDSNPITEGIALISRYSV